MEQSTLWSLIFSLNQTSIFFWMFVMGTGFTCLTFMLGEMFDGIEDVFHGIADFFHLDAVFDIDTDAGGDGPSIFSPRIISVFITIFGGSGLISSYYQIGPVASSAIGIVSSIAITAPFYKFFSWMYKQRANSIIRNDDLVGKSALVRTEIPARGLGEVKISYIGTTLTRSARSKDGEVIHQNTPVVVEEVMGQIVVVSPQ